MTQHDKVKLSTAAQISGISSAKSSPKINKTKGIETHEEKQVQALKNLKSSEPQKNHNQGMFSKELQNNKAKKEINETKMIDKRTGRKDLIYVTNRYAFNVQQFETKRCFVDNIFNVKIHQMK